MCVILYNPNGVKYNEREIRNACATNDDGFGVMWLENGKVKSFRGILSANEIVETLNSFDGVPNVVHLRFATHGPVVPDLCHPFQVTPDDADQKVMMMHNGVLYEHGQRAKHHESDTLVFARDRQDDVRQFGTSDIIFDEDYVKYMEDVISGDRMIFLRDDGKVQILSQRNWHVDEETGIWYSNRYSVADRPRYDPRSWASLASTALAANRAATNSAQDPETFGELADELAEQEWIQHFGRDATAPLPRLPANASEDDDEVDMAFYFKWDEEKNDFVACNEDEADIEVDADEFFSRLAENDGNETATILEFVAEAADEDENEEKSEQYHDLIDNFLTEYRESLGTDEPATAVASSVED